MSNYIGNQPSAGEFKRLDSIASSFNGSATQFNLTYNSVSSPVGDSSQLIVSLNGIIQEPLNSYTLGVGGSSIVFASAPASGDECYIVSLGGVGGTSSTITDNSITSAKINDGAVTSSKISIDGDISFPDNDKLIFGDDSDLEIYSDGTTGQLVGDVNVTGTVTSDGLTVQSNNYLDIHDADNHVSGRLRNVSGSNNALAIEADPNNSASDSFINFKIDTSEKMRIRSTGHVEFNPVDSFSGLNNSILGSSNGYQYFMGGANGLYLADNANLSNAIGIRDAGFLDFITGGTGEKMRITSTGNVGIGTDAPAHKLDVNGAIATRQVRHGIRPTLNLDFANSKQLDPRITFYRDSIATYYDSKGVLRYANVNEPRFDHDPDTGESKGLLIEEQRKNAHLSKTNTFEFDYNGGHAYYKLNAGISPDGRYNAAKICEASTNAAHVYDAYTVFESSGTGTASLFVKPAGRQGVYFTYYDAFGGQTSESTYFILVGDGEASNSSGTIQKLSNGWYRITRTWTSIANNGSVLRIGLTTGASAGGNYGTGSYQGDGQSGILIWGTQQESAAFATSYIPADNRFTSRPSVATYHDATGILRTAPANGARYGYKYDGRKWVETGLILESSATNLALDSAMNASPLPKWSPSAATIIIGDYGLNPDNSQGNTMLVRTNQVAGSGKHIRQSFTIQQAEDYTISVYAKLPSGGTNAYDFLYIRLYDATNAASFQAWFNIDTGTVGTVSQNAYSANIEDVGNGWYRCSVSGRTTTSSNTGTMLYDLFVAETDGVGLRCENLFHAFAFSHIHF